MQDDAWLGALPALLTTLVLLFAPGWAAARLLGLSGLWCPAVAPLLTTTTLVVAGVAAPIIGVSWGLLPLLVSVLLLLAVAGALGAGLTRLAGAEPRARGRDSPTRMRRSAVGVGAGLLFAVLAVAVVYLPLTGNPDAIPQQPDTIFHLGAVQLMARTHDISVLHATAFGSTTGGAGFYPAAFHAVAATVSIVTGASSAVSCSVLALVIAAVIWPLGCMLLARTVLGESAVVSLTAGVGSMLFTAFPFWLMGYGVLWPNLFGLALLPAALACLAVAVREPSPDLPRRRRWTVVVVLVAGVPALAVAHPNALFSFLLFGYFIVVGAVIGWHRHLSRASTAAVRRLVAALVVASLVGVVAAAALTSRMSSMRSSGNKVGPEMPLHQSLMEVLTYAHRGSPHLWVAGAAVIAGLVVILACHRRQWWVVAAAALSAVLYVLDTAVDSPTTRLLTWPWYNNSPRLAAQLVIPGVVALTAALVALIRAAGALLDRRGARSWVAVPVVVVLLVVGTAGAYAGPHREVLDPYFRTTSASAFASPGEIDALQVLSRHLPAGAVVAADPWKGATYLYLVTGQPMLIPTEKAALTPDITLIAKRFDDAGRAPAVCAAAKRLGVRYAITGGTPYFGAGRRVKRFAGIDGVGRSSAFREVATAGPFTLYELTRCATG